MNEKIDKYKVVEDHKAVKSFPTKEKAMAYFRKRKKKTHELMAVYRYKDGKWVGVTQN